MGIGTPISHSRQERMDHLLGPHSRVIMAESRPRFQFTFV